MDNNDLIYEDISDSLRTLSNKLRAMAYLIENTDDQGTPPLDIQDIHSGMGQILSEMAFNVRKYSQHLEHLQIVNEGSGRVKRRKKP